MKVFWLLSFYLINFDNETKRFVEIWAISLGSIIKSSLKDEWNVANFIWLQKCIGKSMQLQFINPGYFPPQEFSVSFHHAEEQGTPKERTSSSNQKWSRKAGKYQLVQRNSSSWIQILYFCYQCLGKSYLGKSESISIC